MGGPLLSFLPFTPDCRRPEQHPDPHPAEESPTGNSSSPSNTLQAWHRESSTHCYLWNVMLFPPQHLRGPVPGRHFAASQLPRAGDGVSSAIFILLLPAIPPLGCCTHREAQGLEMLLFKEPPPCPPQESLDWVKSPRPRGGWLWDHPLKSCMTNLNPGDTSLLVPWRS